MHLQFPLQRTSSLWPTTLLDPKYTFLKKMAYSSVFSHLTTPLSVSLETSIFPLTNSSSVAFSLFYVPSLWHSAALPHRRRKCPGPGLQPSLPATDIIASLLHISDHLSCRSVILPCSPVHILIWWLLPRLLSTRKAGNLCIIPHKVHSILLISLLAPSPSSPTPKDFGNFDGKIQPLKLLYNLFSTFPTYPTPPHRCAPSTYFW